MKLIEFIRRIFLGNGTPTNIYPEAIAEAVKDTLDELGYAMGLDDKS